MRLQDSKELWKVIQAWSEGKTVQYHAPDRWIDVRGDADQCFDRAELYRIKPEPMEFWLEHVRTTGKPSLDWEVNSVKPDTSREVIHVKEVI